MNLSIRRVVTGHDGQGRVKVLIDETVKNVASQRPGGDVDPSGKKIGTTIPDGTVFRIVSFGPGVAPRNHRTDSIDYAVVMSGEIDMDLDGTIVHLKAGDVLVQRGTIHNWINKALHDCLYARISKIGDRGWKDVAGAGLAPPARHPIGQAPDSDGIFPSR